MGHIQFSFSSNQYSFFTGLKMLKYFNDFYNWQLSILLENWEKKTQNQTGHKQIWQHFS